MDEQKQTTVELPPLAEGMTRMFLDLPEPMLERLAWLGRLMNAPTVGHLIDRGLSLLALLANRATQGDHRVVVDWNAGKPAPSVIRLVPPGAVIGKGAA